MIVDGLGPGGQNGEFSDDSNEALSFVFSHLEGVSNCNFCRLEMSVVLLTGGGNLRAVVFAGSRLGVFPRHGGVGWAAFELARLRPFRQLRARCEIFSFFSFRKTLARASGKHSCTFGQKWYLNFVC